MTATAGNSTMGYSKILYSVRDRVAWITLNDPARLNAMDHGPGSMQREVIEALEAADRDDAVRCMVVTGAGKAFSSGGVMGSGAGHPEDAVDWYRFMATEDADNERIRSLDKPVIGAINGLCYGAAFMMALHFDMLVAARSARLGLIETRFGSVGADVLMYMVGPQWAKFLALSGELIDAPTAKRIGLVLEVVEDDALIARVADLARRVAAIPPTGVMFNRRVLNGALDAQGWHTHKHYALALNALTNSRMHRAASADGRPFRDLMRAGWQDYKTARDAPFQPPWLSGDD